MLPIISDVVSITVRRATMAVSDGGSEGQGNVPDSFRPHNHNLKKKEKRNKGWARHRYDVGCKVHKVPMV